MNQFSESELFGNFTAAGLAQCGHCGAFFKTADGECDLCQQEEEEQAAA